MKQKDIVSQNQALLFFAKIYIKSYNKTITTSTVIINRNMWNVKNKTVPIVVEYLDYLRKYPNNNSTIFLINHQSQNSEI